MYYMNKALAFFKKKRSSWEHAFFLILITLVIVVIAKVTIVPNTFFWAWDNLNPEIDVGITIQRSLAGVWQEYQGVGNIGGHGYASALIHSLAIGLLDLILPSWAVRYTFTFLMYWLGAVGCYYFCFFQLRQFIKKSLIQKVASFLGALMYLLHFGTVATFFVQLEPFIIFYAAIPWLLLVFEQYLTKKTPKSLVTLLGVNLFASTIGFIPPLFLLYGIMLAVTSGWYIATKPTRKSLNEILVAGIVILAAHAYWLLPVVYYSLTSSEVYLHSQLNSISTPEFILKHEAYGTLSDVALLKGFFFESLDVQQSIKTGEYRSILHVWETHLSQIQVKIIGFGLFISSLLGALLLELRTKQRRVRGYALIFVLLLIVLAQAVWPLTIVNDLIQKIPLLNQALRSPYNKISMLVAFFSAFFTATSLGILLDWLSERKELIEFQMKLIITGVALIFMGLLGYYSQPVFQGSLLFEHAKVSPPSEYQELFSFLKTQPQYARVATLPVHSYNGWVTYDWGYAGSGFLWYGIDQPLLDRAFDVWSVENESYFDELSHAVYSNNSKLFWQVLQKYGVSFVVLDGHIIEAKKNQEYFKLTLIRQMLDAQGVDTVFESGAIAVYDIREITSPFHQPLMVPTQVTLVQNSSEYNRIDSISEVVGPYIVDPNSFLAFPFQRLTIDRPVPLSFDNHRVTLVAEVPPDTKTVSITPYASGSHMVLPAEISYQDSRVDLEFLPYATISSSDTQFELPTLPPISFEMTSKKNQPEKIFVSINDQTLEIAENESKEVWLTNVVANREIVVLASDASSVEKSGNTYVITDSEYVTTTISEAVWEELLAATEFTFNPPISEIILQINALETVIPASSLTDTTNCDVYGRGTTSSNSEAEKAVLESNHFGTLCPGIPLDHLNNRFSHLLRFTGENISGKSIGWYISESDQQPPKLQHLLPEKSYDLTYSLLEQSRNADTTYKLVLENRSYGSVPTKNTLSVKTYTLPIPSRQIAQITAGEATFVNNSSLKVGSVKKDANYLYSISISDTNQSGYLTLMQGYHEGWVALHIKPSLGLLDHFKFNGWANSCLIPEETSSIILLFWPQLLSFLGTINLLVVLLVLVKKLPQRKSRIRHTLHDAISGTQR